MIGFTDRKLPTLVGYYFICVLLLASILIYKLYTLLLDELVSRNLKICRIVYFKISEEIVTPTYRLLEKWTISSDDIFMAFD